MKKRIFKFLLPIACGLFSMTALAAPKAPVTVEKQGSTIAVMNEGGATVYTCPYKKRTRYAKKTIKYRTGPSDKYAVKHTRAAGKKVTVVGKIKDGKWSIVKTKKGHYYFIWSKHLSKTQVITKMIYSPSHFRRAGVIHWGGWRWTWYSQRVLPGGGLRIPGRHVNKNGYVCDKNGYICLASGKLKKGTVVKTPFGAKGKVYDSGCASGTLDVYCNF